MFAVFCVVSAALKGKQCWCCSYVALRILGIPVDDQCAERARSWVCCAILNYYVLYRTVGPNQFRIALRKHVRRHADTIPGRNHLHSILGEVLAGGFGLLFVEWNEPDSPGNVAVALQRMDRHRVAAPRPLLVPLPHGVPPHVVCVRQAWYRLSYASCDVPQVLFLPPLLWVIIVLFLHVSSVSSTQQA